MIIPNRAQDMGADSGQLSVQIHGSDSDPWIGFMDVIHGADPWIRSMDRIHGSDPWVRSMNLIHGSDPWIRSYN